MKTRHLIIGGNGTIGRETARVLGASHAADVTIASRNPQKVNPSDQLLQLDVLTEPRLTEKLRGFEVVHLILGLPYKASVWAEGFPKALERVVGALAGEGTKLVYFDNVYMYGKVKGWMTEQTPIHPVSVKGAARAKAAQIVTDAVEKGKLQAMICRSADFYGDFPMFDLIGQIAGKLKAGKKAQVVFSDHYPHSLTYIPDSGKAVAFLSKQADAWNQVWHMPTDRFAPTGRQLVELVAEAIGVPPRHTTAPGWLLKIVSLFNPGLTEMMELSYQWEAEYLFDSSKIEKAYGLKPTPIRQGIREHLALLAERGEMA